MRPEAYIGDLLWDLPSAAQTDSPVQGIHLARSRPFHPGNILAAGQPGRFQTSGIGKNLPGPAAGDRLSLVQDQQFLAEPVDLIPVMGYEEHGSCVCLQHFVQFLLQPVFQKLI